MPALSPSPARPPCPFSPPERELIRRELGLHFGQLPSVADGLFLRTWRGGPQEGQPKLPPAVQTMIERGFIEVRVGQRWPWPLETPFGTDRFAMAFFTEAGQAALRELARDKRLLDPERFAHVRRELGLEDAASAAE